MESGSISNQLLMDNLFFKPHELAARDRKVKTGSYL
jgi:hypothetical protein